MIVKVTKSVWQFHDKNEDLTDYFEEFRHVTNESIRLGLERGLTSRKSFHESIYHELKSDLYSSVKQNAIYSAKSLLKTMRTNKRKGKNAGVPYVTKRVLKFTNQSYKIADGCVELYVKVKTRIKIKLASYVLENIDGAHLGGITITPNKIVLAYSKRIEERAPLGYVGIDMNFDNATTCDTDGKIVRYDLSKVGKAKQQCRKTVSRFKRNDHRIRKKIATKHGRIAKNRTQDVLHKTSKKILESGYVPVREDLEGITKLWDKKAKKGKNANFKGKNWRYYELGRQLDYKARQNGDVPIKVNPRGTSSKCAACGGKMITEERRMVRCPIGNVTIDRDKHACINILARGPKVGLVGSANEAMVMDSHERISLMVKNSVDADQLANCRSRRLAAVVRSL